LTSDCGDRGRLGEIEIGTMTAADLDDVLDIERHSFPSAWSRESYAREIRNRNSYYFVARYREELVGYAGMWVIADEAHITTLAVHPSRRRRGLGTRLLLHLLEAAKRRGANRVTLEVRESNLAAQALYEKSGFRRRGFLHGYYGDTGENGVVMWKALPPQTRSAQLE
jgi:ribosomal-protein-alanine N-acetyltransferase